MDELDGIFCINLEDRKERYIQTKRVFDKLNINVTFYHPQKHSTSGRIGCFESHVNIIRDCYNKQMNRILIFEDDIVDTPSYSDEKMKEIVTFLKHNEWIEYFQLGYSICPHEVTNFFFSKNIHGNEIIQYCGLLTHAYIVNRKGMERILATWGYAAYEKEMHIDKYYVKMFKNNSGAVCPILFDQNFCTESDNTAPPEIYLKILRSISCVSSRYKICYRVSIIRYYRSEILRASAATIIVVLLLLLFVLRSKVNPRKSSK